MSSWLTERQLRDDVMGLQSLTLNVAFLNEIKQDNDRPLEIIGDIKRQLATLPLVDTAELACELNHLRDELETHFALEEFYGYFKSAELTHPQISVRAGDLRSQHEELFLTLCDLVELAESAHYREAPLEKTMLALSVGFHSFVQNFNRHEQEETDLMMRLCNDDIGVGD
ncbi:MAG: hemerythrin domain-containing protein [Pirellulaceae bacterium]